jgi:hypothetical protein
MHLRPSDFKFLEDRDLSAMSLLNEYWMAPGQSRLWGEGSEWDLGVSESGDLGRKDQLLKCVSPLILF